MKTPIYTKNAINKYNKNHKRYTVIVTCEEADRMKAAGITAADIKALALAELDRREAAAPPE